LSIPAIFLKSWYQPGAIIGNRPRIWFLTFRQVYLESGRAVQIVAADLLHRAYKV